ncbi:hypothetical protein HK101_002910 [Irineochytrium annulatum]|nr:hypothetical protein HK101_002910 [Irineochytrium annulatum]
MPESDSSSDIRVDNSDQGSTKDLKPAGATTELQADGDDVVDKKEDGTVAMVDGTENVYASSSAFERRPARTWKRKACIGCIVVTGVLLVAAAIILPVMVLVYIPHYITTTFSTPSNSSHWEIQMVDLISLEPGANNTFDGDEVGGFNAKVTAIQTGYKLPLGVPITLLPTSLWNLRMSKAFAEADGSGVIIDQTDIQDWVSVMDIQCPDPFDIYDSLLHFNSSNGPLLVRFPKFSGEPLPSSISNAVDPLAVAVVNGVIKTFISGNPLAAPIIQLYSVSDFRYMIFKIKNVPLYGHYDLGHLLADNGLTLPSIFGHLASSANATSNATSTSTPASATPVPSTGFNITFQNASYFSSSTNVVGATINIVLPFASPLTLNLTNLSARVNVSSSALALLTVNSLSTTAGNRFVSITADLQTLFDQTPAATLVNSIEALVATPVDQWGSQWYLSIDDVHLAKPAPGETQHVWLDDILHAIDVRVPLAEIYNDVLEPFIKTAFNVTLPKVSVPSSTGGSGGTGPYVPQGSNSTAPQAAGAPGSSGAVPNAPGSGAAGSPTGGAVPNAPGGAVPNAPGGAAGSSGGSSSGGLGGLLGGFSFGGSGSNGSSLLSNALSGSTIDFQYLKISKFTDAGPPPPAALNTPSAGGIVLATNVKAEGFKIPLPIDLSVTLEAPANLALSVDKSFAADTNRANAADWFPFVSLSILDSVSLIVNNKTAGLNLDENAVIAFPSYTGPGRGGAVPLAVGFVKGIIQCIETGTAAYVPQVQIASTVSIMINQLSVPNIPLSMSLDIGSLLVKEGVTIPVFQASVAASASSPSPGSGSGGLPGGITLSVTNVKPFSGQNTLVSATITVKLSTPNPVSFTLNHLQARLTISGTLIGFLNVDSLVSTTGSNEVTLQVAAESPLAVENVGTLIGQVGALIKTPVAQWVVSLDQIKATDGQGISHPWLNEVLGALAINVPGTLIYDELKPLLSGVLSNFGIKLAAMA